MFLLLIWPITILSHHFPAIHLIPKASEINHEFCHFYEGLNLRPSPTNVLHHNAMQERYTSAPEIPAQGDPEGEGFSNGKGTLVVKSPRLYEV